MPLLQPALGPTPEAQGVRHVEQRIADGVLEGVVSSDEKVRTFKGIPFAAPPVGPLRWRAPQPVVPWTGVRTAIEYPPRCMQGPTPADMTFGDSGPNEDCLYLDLWMPAHPVVSKLPVMVWVNGERFEAGSSSEPRQDAGNLSKKGVLVVSFNYRLGVFGFFAAPELARESPHHASGNYGLLDQIAALRWVKRNIAAFGGDPDNVTLFGAGSGSVSVSALMASPLAQGLFERAIGEGGACLGTAQAFRSRIDAERTGAAFAKSVPGSTSMETLRATPAQEILDAALRQPAGTFAPDIDGDFLRDSCQAVYRAGKQAHVPLLAGWDAEPGGATPSSASTSTQTWLDLQRKTAQAPVFRYEFDQALPGATGAAAAANPAAAPGASTDRPEIEFVFRVLSSRHLAWRAEDRELSETISSYWTNFAKTGDPNGPGLPPWPPYTGRSSDQTQHLGTGIVAVAGPPGR